MEEYIISIDIYEGNEIMGTNSQVTLEFSIGKFHVLLFCASRATCTYRSCWDVPFTTIRSRDSARGEEQECEEGFGPVLFADRVQVQIAGYGGLHILVCSQPLG